MFNILKRFFIFAVLLKENTMFVNGKPAESTESSVLAAPLRTISKTFKAKCPNMPLTKEFADFFVKLGPILRDISPRQIVSVVNTKSNELKPIISAGISDGIDQTVPDKTSLNRFGKSFFMYLFNDFSVIDMLQVITGPSASIKEKIKKAVNDPCRDPDFKGECDKFMPTLDCFIESLKAQDFLDSLFEDMGLPAPPAPGQDQNILASLLNTVVSLVSGLLATLLG